MLKFRREFDQYINLRPVKLFDGVPCPLANKKPGDIDMLIVRENTEGEYSSVGGRMFERTEREILESQPAAYEPFATVGNQSCPDGNCETGIREKGKSILDRLRRR